MKNKIKTILASILCLMFVLTSGLVGCSGGETAGNVFALPHYAYESGQKSAPYNSSLFYRNEAAQKMGDPTTIYIETGEYEGYFLSTGTTSGTGYTGYITKDFVNWTSVGAILTKQENHYGTSCFWAPNIIYDKDAEWADYFIEQKEGERGKGLYFIFYSALTSDSREPINLEDEDTSNDIYPDMYYPAVAISKEATGPYVEFTGVNGNGLIMDAETPLFNLQYLRIYNPDVDKNAVTGQEILKERRSFIDACPFIDPVTGDKYLLMARNRKNDTTNEIWAVKLKDWVTPDYMTVTRLTSFAYTTTDRDVPYEFPSYYYGGKIDEGPFMIYNEVNQKYYLTFSVGGTNDKLYPVAQAVGDSPLGPFEKIQPTKGGIICSPGADSDMNSSGHHSFVTIGDQMYIVYHTYPVDPYSGALAGRGQAFNEVVWMENEDGLLVMHANGPNNTVTPLPTFFSGYENVAPLATATATNGVAGADPATLNDGLIKYHGDEIFDDNVPIFEAKGTTTITLNFDDYVIARSILVYNSYKYESIFRAVKRIEFSYMDENGNTGIAYINNLKFDFEDHITPLTMFMTENELAELTEEEKEEYYIIRAGGAAIAEFDELKINKVKLTIEKPKGKDVVAISDIFIMGKTL